MLGKCSRYLACGVLGVLALLVATWIADELRFAWGQPSDQKVNYSGKWSSDTYPLINGRILAEIPYPLPKEKTFKVQATVYYSVTSPYRLGQFIPMEMDAFVESSGSTAGGNTDKPVILAPKITFTFKSGGGAPGAQTIDYVSTSDKLFVQIAGGYRSSSPYDIGTFTLNKTTP
ncbi:MAG: hypothetical protein AAGK14_01800 [Verrucomicrobiota bacterium]